MVDPPQPFGDANRLRATEAWFNSPRGVADRCGSCDWACFGVDGVFVMDRPGVRGAVAIRDFQLVISPAVGLPSTLDLLAVRPRGIVAAVLGLKVYSPCTACRLGT